jgi:hypothetical protein
VHNHSSTPQVDAWNLWCVFCFHLAFKNVKLHSQNIALIFFTAWSLWARAIPKSRLHLGLASCTLISVILSPLHEKCLLLCYLPGSYVLKSNSTGAQYVNLQIKIRWRKVKTCWFGPDNDFGPTFFHSFLRLMHSKAPHAEEDCNNYDMTAAPCFWLANHDALLLVVFPCICSPVLIL